MVRRPSGSLKTAVSRKASLLSFSVSMVKRMEGCWLFRCGRSQLVRPKDAVDPAKQDGVVYRIPCECGKVYIGETGRPMQTEFRSTIETFDSPVPRPPPFQSMPTTPDISHSGTK